MELDKLKELILSKLFFILGALLILIGYTLAEKLKDNSIILSINNIPFKFTFKKVMLISIEELKEKQRKKNY